LTGVAVYLAHAEYRARESTTGIGAAVTRSELDEDLERVWYCIVTDGREWRYIRVQALGLGPFPAISPDDVEEESTALLGGSRRASTACARQRQSAAPR
jgi:hypothetical protein